MPSRLNAARKSARDYVKRMEAAGYAPYTRAAKAQVAISDYAWLVY